MAESAIPARAIIPSFAYDDAPGAIAFLCAAFGFERQAVYANPAGTIDHAQLTLGGHVIMLGSASNHPDGPSKSPQALGGSTGGVYVVLESDADVDAHHARATAAGARIARQLESPDYGGRGYSAFDSEGYVWSFGSYHPEAEASSS